MDNYEFIIKLLILAGTGILILGFAAFQKNIKLLKEIKAATNQNLPLLITARQIFIIFFISGYLIIFICMILHIHILLKSVTACIIFLGAVFVCLETYFNHNVLKIVKEQYIKSHALNKDLMEERETLFASEKKYRSILENIDESYFEVDLKGNLMFFNDSTCRILEYSREELTYLNYKAFMSKSEIDVVFQLFNSLYRKKSGRAFAEHSIITKNKNKKFIATSIALLHDSEGKPVGFSGLTRDITEKKETEKKQKTLEAQILQAQKLEAIGHLAGGIAHDFNNILTAISGNIKLLMMDRDSFSEKNHKNLANIMEATERAGTLINQVLTFSRQKEEARYPVRLDLILKEAVRFIRSTTPTSIDIKTNINSDSHHVLADSTQIHQVIMNLCTNAKHAMEDQNQGVIEITLSSVELNNFTGIAGNRLHGTFFELCISDTGAGMASEVIEKIFNPFFTTKSTGTGLGLSTVHGIVKSYGGDIIVESKIGKGSVFKVYFPVTAEKSTEVDTVLKNRVLGKGNILLLDDEAWITESFGELFSDYGYNIDVFNSSKEALEAVNKESDYYDVVVTDFQMPEMNGIEFAEKVKKINDKIAIIISSGNISSIPEKDAKKVKLHAIIQKPFDDDKLANIIQDAVDNKE